MNECNARAATMRQPHERREAREAASIRSGTGESKIRRTSSYYFPTTTIIISVERLKARPTTYGPLIDLLLA